MFDKSSGLSIYNTIVRSSRLMIELALCSQRDDLKGIYLSPSFSNPQTWFGIIYVRYGMYSSAAYRFLLIMGDDCYDPSTMRFPESSRKPPTKDTSAYWRLPRIFFYSPTKPYHPHIDPVTGELNLSWYFKSWDEKRHHVWHCLKCLRHIFYNKFTRYDLQTPSEDQTTDQNKIIQNPSTSSTIPDSTSSQHSRCSSRASVVSEHTKTQHPQQDESSSNTQTDDSRKSPDSSKLAEASPKEITVVADVQVSSSDITTKEELTQGTSDIVRGSSYSLSSTNSERGLRRLESRDAANNYKRLFNETAAKLFQDDLLEFGRTIEYNIERTRTELNTCPTVTDDAFEPNFSELSTDETFLVAKNKMKRAGEKQKLTGWQAQNAQTSGHSFIMPGTIKPFSKHV